MQATIEKMKSISNLIKELFDTEPSLGVPTMLLHMMTRSMSLTHSISSLFLYITTEMGKRIPSGKQCRLLTRIAKSVVNQLNDRKVVKSEPLALRGL